MVSPIFFIFLLLSVRLIGCNALCHVVLDVVVEDGVVILVVALRSSELCHFIGYGFGVRQGYSITLMTSVMSQFFSISTIRSSSKAMQPPV